MNSYPAITLFSRDFSEILSADYPPFLLSPIVIAVMAADSGLLRNHRAARRSRFARRPQATVLQIGFAELHNAKRRFAITLIYK